VGSELRVSARLTGRAAAALTELERRFGSRTRAVEAALLAFENTEDLLDRLERIEELLRSGGPGVPVAQATEDPDVANVLDGLLGAWGAQDDDA